MTRPIRPVLYASCLATLFASTGATAQIPADMPRPDPGLWQMQTTIAQMGGMSMGFRICLDESVEDLLIQPDEEANCSEQSYRRDGDRIIVNAVCDADGSEARIEGAFTGDFRRNYSGDVVTNFSPPLQGMARTDMRIDAQWTRPCQAGERPGEPIMQGMPSIPGLGEIDLDALRQGLEQLQRR